MAAISVISVTANTTSDETQMAYWACARLEPRREAVAEHFLQLAGYEVYIPRLRERRLQRHRRVEILAPLFPAYAFLVIERQWHSARWSIGVTAIIMGGVTRRGLLIR